MIYTARELLAKLRHLTLVGQNEKGELEWVGTDKNWRSVNTDIAISEMIYES